MDIKDLLEIIPELLLLFIPGYISIKISEKYALEKKKEHFDVIVYSILYSFIIGIIYSVILFPVEHFCATIGAFLKNTTVKQTVYLILAVVLGYGLVKVTPTPLGDFIRGCFNKNVSPEPSVWIKAMKNTNGAWVTVYLENGIIYTGKLIYYTVDPNDEGKELLLSNYRLSIQNNAEVRKADDFCIDIDDKTGDDNAKVFLSRDVIVSIEIHSRDKGCSNR